jgi:hypothetical protein
MSKVDNVDYVKYRIRRHPSVHPHRRSKCSSQRSEHFAGIASKCLFNAPNLAAIPHAPNWCWPYACGRKGIANGTKFEAILIGSASRRRRPPWRYFTRPGALCSTASISSRWNSCFCDAKPIPSKSARKRWSAPDGHLSIRGHVFGHVARHGGRRRDSCGARSVRHRRRMRGALSPVASDHRFRSGASS